MSAIPLPGQGKNDPISQEEQWRRNYRRKRRFKTAGLILAILGAIIVIVHWLTHLEAFGPGQPPLILDVIAGYPMGGILLIAGGIVAGQK